MEEFSNWLAWSRFELQFIKSTKILDFCKYVKLKELSAQIYKFNFQRLYSETKEAELKDAIIQMHPPPSTNNFWKLV